MRIRRWFSDLVFVFSVTLATSLAVGALGKVLTHRPIEADWDTSLRIAVVLGIIVPWIQVRRCR